MIVFPSNVLVITGPIAINIFSTYSQFMWMEHFVASSSVLHSQFSNQFLHFTFASLFDPFPCPFPLPLTRSRFIFHTLLQQIDYQKTSYRPLSLQKIHSFISLSYRKSFTFLCRKSLELAALVTAGELLSTITNFFGPLTV